VTAPARLRVAGACSSPSRRALVALSAVAACAWAGCALTSRGEPLTVRYFDPEPPRPWRAAAAPQGAPTSCEIALGEISASDDLRQEVVFRRSEYEVGYDETRRWRERPEAYLRRALETALFQAQGCAQVVSGAAPTIDAQLLAFEEQRGTPHLARVVVRVVLSDGRNVLLDETREVTRVVQAGCDGQCFDGVARAVGIALDEGVTDLARAVSAELAERARAAR